MLMLILRRLLARASGALLPRPRRGSPPPPDDGGEPLIRTATPRDAEAITGMIAALASEHGVVACATAPQLADALFPTHAHAWMTAYVVEQRRARALLGVAVLARQLDLTDCRATAVLTHLYVVPEARGKGIGSALLGVACDHARTWRCVAFQVGVTTANPVAQRFYEARGLTRHEWNGITYRLALSRQDGG